MKTTHAVKKTDVICQIPYTRCINIRSSTLQTMYDTFKNRRFTCTEIYLKLWGHRGFSPNLISAHIGYLLENGWIKLVARGPTKKEYRFVVPMEDWKFGGEVH